VDEVADIVLQEMALQKIKRIYSGGSQGWIGDNPVVHLSIDKIKSLGWNTKISSKKAISMTTRWTMNQIKVPAQPTLIS